MAKQKNPAYRYSIIPARAVTDPSITAQALRVLALLGRHTDENGWCRRSQVKMASELSCGRATVQRALDELVAAGYVEKRRETRTGFDVVEDEQPHTAHSYRVRLDLDDDEQEGAHGRAPGVPTSGQGVPAQDGHGVPICRAPTTELSPVEQSPLNTLAPDGAGESGKVASLGQEDLDRWPEFRSAIAQTWPGGFPDENQLACKAEFGRQTRTHAVETLIECARLHGEAKRRQNEHRPAKAGKVVMKLPSNWLRDGDWQGYQAAAQQQRDADARITSALGRVHRALGPDLVEVFRHRLGLGDGVMAALDGITVEPGPPPLFLVTGGAAKAILDRQHCALNRILGDGVEIRMVAKARCA